MEGRLSSLEGKMIEACVEEGSRLFVVSPQGELALPYRPGASIKEILDSAALPLPSSCGGVGACGRCRIGVEAGEATPTTASERSRLGESAIRQGYRLACQARPVGDIRISVAAWALNSAWRDLGENGPQSRVWQGGDAASGVGQAGHAVAVDLGTTQVRVSVVSLATGQRIAGRIGVNPQRCFGADVLTRLTAAVASEINATRLSALAVGAIGEALADIVAGEGLNPLTIERVGIVGNTAMLTLLSGRNFSTLLSPEHWTSEIDCAPHATGSWLTAWGLDAGTTVEVIPAVAGFVGSDLLAGILATHLPEGKGGSLLIDFGTNSEMALWDGEKLWVCSAAGGPAFEGCGISCGMPAEPGAIYRAEAAAEGQEIVCGVLGGGRPAGICGSGLVDCLAVLLRAGRIKANGRFAQPADGNEVVLNNKFPDIVLSHQDIDAVQRAKAAIGAGIESLRRQAGLGVGELTRLCVCGAFGQHLDKANAQRIGLLPPMPAGRIELWSHSALSGCERLLLAPDGRAMAEALRRKCRMVNLALLAGFEDLFVENLYLRGS